MRKIVLLSCLLAGCGGGGGGGSFTPPPATDPNAWVQGVFKPASSFAAQCAAPRTGVDSTGTPFPDTAGSVLTQNNWLRSWSHDWYLWYGEIADKDPAQYTTTAYFDLLKTTGLSMSGQPKDRFHFTYPTDQWLALSQSGVESGYGAHWLFIANTPPRQLVVAYVEPGASAALAGLDRGTEILAIDGVDLVNANDQASIDTLNAGISPAAVGETHQFVVRDFGAATSRTVTLQSQNVTNSSVMNVLVFNTASGNVGYMQFNDHLGGAEKALVDAITTLKSQNITDLILDIRYNSGGYLDIASEAAYMIAGDAATAGKAFERTQFNDKYPNTNPVTGQTLTPTPFIATSQGFGQQPTNVALPTLNLSRVFVITGPDTCSASESIINGLRGADIEVIQIGETTCGKPYGFYPQDNCGTTYFSIQFEGVNEKGFGDYSDGFSPGGAVGSTGAQLPGCAVLDDFTFALGNDHEARIAAALAYRDNPTCPAMAMGLQKPGGSGVASLAAAHGRLVRSPLLENRLYRH